MAKKSENFYFDNFVESVRQSCAAAQFLEATVNTFDADDLPDKMAEMHELEHRGDALKHAMMEDLLRAFITPIERDDIVQLSQNIDDLTDAIEDVLIRLYISNVRTVREDMAAFAALIVKCCQATCDLMEDFRSFKKSKTLSERIIEINHLEEEGDRFYIEAMRRLHDGTVPALEVIVWREIYSYLERCCDACEHIADVVQSIVIANS